MNTKKKIILISLLGLFILVSIAIALTLILHTTVQNYKQGINDLSTVKIEEIKVLNGHTIVPNFETSKVVLKEKSNAKIYYIKASTPQIESNKPIDILFIVEGESFSRGICMKVPKECRAEMNIIDKEIVGVLYYFDKKVDFRTNDFSIQEVSKEKFNSDYIENIVYDK